MAYLRLLETAWLMEPVPILLRRNLDLT